MLKPKRKNIFSSIFFKLVGSFHDDLDVGKSCEVVFVFIYKVGVASIQIGNLP